MGVKVINTLFNPIVESKIIITDNDTVNDIKKIILKSLPKTNLEINRLEFKLKNKLTNEIINLSSLSKPIFSYKGFDENCEIYIFDSGYQINKSISYIIQYGFPLFYVLYLNYNTNFTKNLTQRFTMIMSTTHFLIRIIEGIFIMKNKNNKTSISSLVLNCIFYWVFYSLICAYDIFNENYIEPNWSNIRYLFFISFFICEYFNFTHLIYYNNNYTNFGLFKFVYCPFYFFEILGWICFLIFTETITIFIFTLGIVFILIQKSLKIKEEEEGKIKNFNKSKKNAIIPFFI